MVGDIQIFANPECTRYADGSQATVYARVNRPWGINGGWQTGSEENPASSIYTSAPTTEAPDDPYAIYLWVDWIGENRTDPYQNGEVVELTNDGFEEPITNPNVIFTKP